MKVKIEVVKVEGKCSAGYKPGDVFYLNEFILESEKPLCIHAVLAVSHVAYALAHGMDI
ncbi:MAG: TIGR04076 family protein, partial [Archaeoglobi archaeon]|nr:TIGR04076 family protein [Candidatus Mnemosynella sp.]